MEDFLCFYFFVYKTNIIFKIKIVPVIFIFLVFLINFEFLLKNLKLFKSYKISIYLLFWSIRRSYRGVLYISTLESAHRERGTWWEGPRMKILRLGGIQQKTQNNCTSTQTFLNKRKKISNLKKFTCSTLFLDWFHCLLLRVKLCSPKIHMLKSHPQHLRM